MTIYHDRKVLSKESIIEWLSIDGRGIQLIGEYINAKNKTTFQCSQGHKWKAYVNNIKRGRGCPVCNEITTNKFSSWLAINRQDITLIGDYVSAKTKTLFQCGLGHQWETQPCNIKTGYGCPSCAVYGFSPNKPAWAYVFARENYIKYGITNSLPSRMNAHNRYGKVDIICLHYYENGQDALDWERKIKTLYGGCYAHKDQCPDGYTETLPIHLSESILLMI